MLVWDVVGYGRVGLGRVWWGTGRYGTWHTLVYSTPTDPSLHNAALVLMCSGLGGFLHLYSTHVCTMHCT